MSDPVAPLTECRQPPLKSQTLVTGATPAVHRLCLCVDDFGLHGGIDTAALRLVDMHRVHAVGCLVGGPSWVESSRSLRRFGLESLDVGLHLDLTEVPLLGVSPRSLRALIVASHLRLLDRRSIRAQIRAQLDTFEQVMGRAPAFVDGHQHVHQLPVVRDELLAELTARSPIAVPWLRSTRAPCARPAASAVSPCRFKPWVIERLGAAALASAAGRLGYPQNRHLLGVYDFRGGRERYRELLAGWLHTARDGDLLMCHPSLPSKDADPLMPARVAEFEVLASDGFDAGRSAAHVQLTPMSQMLVPRR